MWPEELYKFSCLFSGYVASVAFHAAVQVVREAFDWVERHGRAPTLREFSTQEICGQSNQASRSDCIGEPQRRSARRGLV